MVQHRSLCSQLQKSWALASKKEQLILMKGGR